MPRSQATSMQAILLALRLIRQRFRDLGWGTLQPRTESFFWINNACHSLIPLVVSMGMGEVTHYAKHTSPGTQPWAHTPAGTVPCKMLLCSLMGSAFHLYWEAVNNPLTTAITMKWQAAEMTGVSKRILLNKPVLSGSQHRSV